MPLAPVIIKIMLVVMFEFLSELFSKKIKNYYQIQKKNTFQEKICEKQEVELLILSWREKKE